MKSYFQYCFETNLLVEHIVVDTFSLMGTLGEIMPDPRGKSPIQLRQGDKEEVI